MSNHGPVKHRFGSPQILPCSNTLAIPQCLQCQNKGHFKSRTILKTLVGTPGRKVSRLHFRLQPCPVICFSLWVGEARGLYILKGLKS